MKNCGTATKMLAALPDALTAISEGQAIEHCEKHRQAYSLSDEDRCKLEGVLGCLEK